MNSEMFQSIFKTVGYKMAGRLHSPKDRIGKTFVNADGQEYVIFKQTTLDPVSGQKVRPEAVFRVQFQVRKIIPWRDRFIISIKSPMFVAKPGFRSKIWMVDKKNKTYQGVYEWEPVADAQAYGLSYSMKFMTQVAAPDGIAFEIVPGGEIDENNFCLRVIKA